MSKRPGIAAGLVLVSVLGFGSVAGAELYKWIDENGNVQFTDDLSKVPPASRSSAATPGAKPAPLNRFDAPERPKVERYRPKPTPSKQAERARRERKREALDRELSKLEKAPRKEYYHHRGRNRRYETKESKRKRAAWKAEKRALEAQRERFDE